MDNPASEEHDDQCHRQNNGSKDSTSMTIEYLRARLLAERSVSKASRERGDELARLVFELEEQLKIMSFKKRKAEDAARDLLASLEYHGTSDISEPYDSESEQEGSVGESHESKRKSRKEDGSSVYSEVKTKDKVVSSDSEHESTQSSSGNLSWKGRRKTSHSSDKKYYDSTFRRHSSFTLFGSSPKHRLGKSCRQIKRKESRPALEESGHDSTKPESKPEDPANNSSCSGIEPLEFRSNGQTSGFVEDNSHVGNSSKSPLKVNQPCISEMKRALEHQTQVIGRYEAEERVQREWEEKYKENDSSTPDSCEPGNHSDVTEERDDTRAAASHPAEIIFCRSPNPQLKNEVSNFSREAQFSYLNSFKMSTHEEIQPPSDLKFGGQASGSAEFAFPVVSNSQSQEYLQNYTVQCPSNSSPRFHPCHDSSGIHNVSSSLVINNSCESVSVTTLYGTGSHRPEAVIEVLQNARALLKQNFSGLPPADSVLVTKAIQHSSLSSKDKDLLKIPVGCAELFRVPTDFRSEAQGLTRTGLKETDYSSYPATSYPYSKGLLAGRDQFFPSPGEPSSSVSGFNQFGHSPMPSFDFNVRAPTLEYTQPSSSYPSLISRASSPSYSDMTPRISSPSYSDLAPRVTYPYYSDPMSQGSSPVHPQFIPLSSSNDNFHGESSSRVAGAVPNHSSVYGDQVRRSIYR